MATIGGMAGTAILVCPAMGHYRLFKTQPNLLTGMDLFADYLKCSQELTTSVT
jgi:hypothetical protein